MRSVVCLAIKQVGKAGLNYLKLLKVTNFCNQLILRLRLFDRVADHVGRSPVVHEVDIRQRGKLPGKPKIIIGGIIQGVLLVDTANLQPGIQGESRL